MWVLGLSSNAWVFAFVHAHLKGADSLQAADVVSSSAVELSTKRPDLPQGFMFQNEYILGTSEEQGAPLALPSSSTLSPWRPEPVAGISPWSSKQTAFVQKHSKQKDALPGYARCIAMLQNGLRKDYTGIF